MSNIITVHMLSESDISVKGHGVHTAYQELAVALNRRSDIRLVTGQFKAHVVADVLHIHTIGYYAWKKLLQKHSNKKVISAHVVPDSLIGSIRMAKYWMFAMRIYMRLFYNRADLVLAVSNKVAEILHQELKVPQKKIRVLYNTIDMKQYHFSAEFRAEARQRLGYAADDFIVLGNGQVQPRKRVDTFKGMAEALPDAKFIWVGGVPFKHLGEDYHAMKKLMESAPENMLFTGVIDHTLVRDYLAVADAFALPSDQENHPMCVLEAAGAGIPIILREIPEYNDTFKPNAIFASSDEEFIEAVRRLRDDREFYQKYQQQSQVIASRFDSATGAEQVTDYYRGLLNED